MNAGRFPDAPSGPDRTSMLVRLTNAFVASATGARITRRFIPIDHWVMRRTSGRFSFLRPLRVPTLLLTTVGRKSGELRNIVLTYLRDGDRILVIASNSGGPTHPAWSLNLLADPSAWVTIRGERIPVRATQVTGDEYDRLWSVFADYSTVFPAYRQRTTRELRMFALVRRPG